VDPEAIQNFPGDVQSLAQRNLLRQLTFGLPSGQSVAKAMKQPGLDPDHLDDLEPLNLDNRTPLWFYVVREAEVQEDGKQLGPVGGRIIAEVFIGLLQGDALSYLKQDPDRTPTLKDPARMDVIEQRQISRCVEKGEQ
jgi:hypothetical protein